MRWWVIAFVVLAVLWWLGHRHLNRRVRKLAAAGALGPAAKAACGCGGAAAVAAAAGSLGSNISPSVNTAASQTSGGNQISPSPVGTLPTSVGDDGPAAVPVWNPNASPWS
jgi:hypothetical protein